MLDTKKEIINGAIDDIVKHYEDELAYLKNGINALNEVEKYLSKSGLSFTDIAYQLGYAIVEIKEDKVDTEVEKTKDTEKDLQTLSKQEIVDLIVSLKPDYKVSVTNVTKDEIIKDYLSLNQK